MPKISSPFEACYERLTRPARKLKSRIRLKTRSCTQRSSYTRRTRPKNRRQARFRGIRIYAQSRAFKSKEDADKKNTWAVGNVWVGNQDDAAILKSRDITRVFHLDRKTIVLQPHVDPTPYHPPQLAFYDAYDYDKNNFLKDFNQLCAIMRVEAWLGNGVLIYCATKPTREDSSRVRTLVIAYGMYTGQYRPKRFHKRSPRPFKGVRIKHMEQLRVWHAMLAERENSHRMLIYEGWRRDREAGLVWRERFVVKGPGAALHNLEASMKTSVECVIL